MIRKLNAVRNYDIYIIRSRRLYNCVQQRCEPRIGRDKRLVTDAHMFVLRLMDPDIGTAGDAMKLMRLVITNQLNSTALNDRRVRVRVTLNQISIPRDSRGASKN